MSAKEGDSLKKMTKCLAGLSLAVFVFAWGVMGLKLLDNNYLITTEAYVGLISLLVFFPCILYVKLANHSPHSDNK